MYVALIYVRSSDYGNYRLCNFLLLGWQVGKRIAGAEREGGS